MTRFVLISDTHNRQPNLPEGDILLHAGDHTLRGSQRETQMAGEYLGRQAKRFKHIVTIGGNHDWFMYHAHAEVMRQFFAKYADNIVYLENELWATELDGKVFSIYGSPVQPEFCNWAWNESRGEEIRRTWDRIPTFGVDILMTHGPAHHILDWVGHERVGCADLRETLSRVQPKLFVFGHIHAAYGKAQAFIEVGRTIDCYNASVVDEGYKLANKPWVLDYDGEKFTEVPNAI